MATKKQRRRTIDFNEALKDPRGEAYTQRDREGKQVEIVLGDIVEGILSMSPDKPDSGERRKRLGLVERMINRAALDDDTGKEHPFHKLEMRRTDCTYIIDLLEKNPPSENQFIMQRMVDILNGTGPDALHYEEDDWEEDDEEEDIDDEVDSDFAEAAGG